MFHSPYSPAPDLSASSPAYSLFTVEHVQRPGVLAASGLATLWIGLRGNAAIQSGGRRTRLEQGSALVLHEDACASLYTDALSSVLVIGIESAALSGAVRQLPFPDYSALSSTESGLAVELSRSASNAHPYAVSSLVVRLIESRIEAQRTLVARCPGVSWARRNELFGRLQRVRLYLRAHVDRRVEVPLLAEMVGFCRWRLTKVYRAVYGCGPYEDHCRMRLEYARSLLDDHRRSVQEVGSAAGFDSSSAFARAFRKHFQLSATAYRTLRPRAGGGPSSCIASAPLVNES
jgi:AraC family transcriptional regulator